MSVNQPGSAEWLEHQAGEPENCPKNKPSQEFIDKIDELWNIAESILADEDKDFFDGSLMILQHNIKKFWNKFDI